MTMYAQWRSVEDYEAMRRDPAPLPFLQEALTIAKFESAMYEVVRTFSRPVQTAQPIRAGMKQRRRSAMRNFIIAW